MSLLQPPDRPRRTLRLGARLGLGFGALVAVVAAVTALSVWQFRALARHGEQVIAQDLRRMLKVQEIDRHVQSHGVAMARLLTAARAERERIYPRVDAENAAVGALIATFRRDSTDVETRSLLGDLAERSQRYAAVFVDVVTEIEAGDAARAARLFDGEGQRAMRAVLEASDALLRHEQSTLAARQQAVRDQIQGTQDRLAMLALGAVGLAVALAWRTTVAVTRPLGQVEAAAIRMADGDYRQRVPVTGDDELGRVSRVMNELVDAVAAREARLEGVAYVDALTGLPNRAMLRRLSSERSLAAAGASVILLDVARLRTINEVLGFDTGDGVLVEVARRLRAVVDAQPEADGRLTLGRLPGGVFAVLCEGLDRPGVDALRGQLDAAAAEPLACDGHAVDVHLICGMAACGQTAPVGAGGTGPFDVALRRAELALGEAKRQKLRWVWHAAVDDESRARQLSLLSDLRRAARDGQLEMWFQPKQCLRSRRILGMEGLVRWRHPQRGFVSPAEFIAFAERTGHIGIVTTAMLEAGLGKLAALASSHPELSLAVNVSALDVRDAEFASRVEQIAARHHAPLSRLRLEITESSVMEDADRVLPVLHALRARGIQLSIDDFGTGYSSLAYLQRLPVSELKIDRSFVAGADRSAEASALLQTIVELGHSLKMTVTAEGVEREEERDLLLRLGCDQVQGYLIARPMAPDAMRRFLSMPEETPQSLVTA